MLFNALGAMTLLSRDGILTTSCSSFVCLVVYFVVIIDELIVCILEAQEVTGCGYSPRAHDEIITSSHSKH